MDLLQAGAPARVVSVSSGAAAAATIDFDNLQGERRYSHWRAYAQSKLANVLFTAELARRLEGTGVTVNCLHPGFVRSNFANSLRLARAVIALMRPFTISPEAGAETAIYLASSPEVEGVTGQYFVKKRAVQPSREARDPAVARRLWQVSEALTKLG